MTTLPPARRYAVGVIHLKFSKNAVLMMNEVLKMGFSVAMVMAGVALSLDSPPRYCVQSIHIQLMIPSRQYIGPTCN